MSEELEQQVPEVESIQVEEKQPMSFEDGVIKVDLAEFNKATEQEPVEQQPEVEAVTPDQPSEEVIETPVEAEEPMQVLEEITEEEVVEQVEQLNETVSEAIQEQRETGQQLPDNIQKVVEFMEETGGTLEDYVKLNTDYASLDETQLLREYYESSKPHLDRDEIDFLMEDNFSFDEDVDDERDIRRKKMARKEELANAKSHLDNLKSKYYNEIKAGSRLNPEQRKAVEFFDRYNKENEEATKIAEHQVSTFKSKTEGLFSDEFKGFDFNIGDKKFRYKVNNVDQVKDTQSDINNFVKKFLNDKNEMSDAAGYHKSLFTAMNTDAIANHFYEQGKADAMKSSIQKAKNIDMSPRGAHEEVKASNGWQVRAINPGVTSKFGIKTKK
ncbi:hypothetical protein N9P20_00795 [Polaribacter sp.]|nr:hypothetical protein [Polaribacter sp.]